MSSSIAETASLSDGPAAPSGLRSAIGIFVMIGAVLFNMLLLTAITPVLSTAAKYFGTGSDAQIIAQMIITMTAIGIMIGGPLAGWLAERLTLRTVLILALALYGTAGASGLFLESATGLLAARFLQGLSAGGIAISSYSMIAERFQGSARPRMLGYQSALTAAAGFVTGLGAGQLAEAEGWRAPFGLYLLAFGMIALALVAQGIPVGRRHAEVRTSDDSGPKGSLWSIWHLYLMLIPLYAAAFMFYLQLSFLLAGDGIGSPALQSKIMAAITATNFIAGLVYGRVLERLRPRRMFCLILAVMAASDIVVGIGHGVVCMTVGCALAGFAGGGIVPFVTNLITTRAPPALRSRGLGFMYSLVYVGQFANPFTVTPLRMAIGNHEAFLVVGGLLAAAALIQGLYPKSVAAGLA